MSTLRQQVMEFHRTFGHPIAESPTIPPRDRIFLRLKLIHEEFHELLEAAGYYESDDWSLEARHDRDFDLVEAADALADLDYVIEGMRLECGINGEPIADEVHRSNMSKLGAEGRPLKRADGKTMKGPNFRPPDIAGELRKQGWRG